MLGELQVPYELLLAVAGGIVLWFGVLLGRAARRREPVDVEELQGRLGKLDRQVRDRNRQLARMRSEQNTVASLAMSLPHVVRELNRDDLKPSRIPHLVLNLAEAIFHPRQMLFYVSRSVRGKSGERRELQLISHHGLSEVPPTLRTVGFGEGKIGWVAEHKLDMLREDWVNLARTEGVTLAENDSKVSCDIVGPFVHHARQGEQVLGVLCIGAPTSKPRDEKLMFQLVTNLGSLALVSARNLTKLRQLANTDGLTGMLNKRYLMNELAVMIVNAERQAKKLSLFIFDIDHFKNFNDTNGHPAGDDLLRRLAHLVKERIRPSDWCCRYGGEEFLVAMPETDGDEAFALAEAIRRSIEQHPFSNRDTQPGGIVSVSGGVATFPQDGTSIAELVGHADQALYESKRAGRNRVKRFRGLEIGDTDDEPVIDMQADEESEPIGEC